MRSYTFLPKELSCQLRGLIIASGLDLTSMANKMNMSRQTLAHRLNGKIDFTKTEMETFASILKVKPDEIFFNNNVAFYATNIKVQEPKNEPA